MNKDTITINKKLIPYTFDIELSSEIFTFYVDYNNTGKFFTIGLSKNGEVICSGEPIVYGIPLFRDIYVSGLFPAVDIIPLSMSKSYDAVTYDNLCETVLLLIDNGDVPLLEGDSNE